MNKKVYFILIGIFYASFIGSAQNLEVETILNLNASGGVTFGPDGNIYVSDFGPALGTPSVNTRVYKVEYGTWNAAVFASGFRGASGSVFDSQGNFYQANPSGGRISKRTPGGSVDFNWVTQGLNGGPIGLVMDTDENIYACNCGTNTVQKITLAGTSTLFASSNLFRCPNGITIDPDNNLYVCNFSDGRILKITPSRVVSLFKTLPTFQGFGNGHLTYSNGFLFVATIGTGQIYKISLTGEAEVIAGISGRLSNIDGPALEATFSKPNGVAASSTGDTLFVNTSVPTWTSNRNGLHPGRLRMITGVCSLPDVECPMVTSTKEIANSFENQQAHLFPPAPNPAKSETRISFNIHQFPQKIKLKIVDVSQRTHTILFEGRKTLGSHDFLLNTSNWPSGIYYAILEGEGFSLTQKILILK